MKSPSLERVHSELERNIKFVESYTEIENLGFIIKACRLKPYQYIFENYRAKVYLYRQWFDEFYNSLSLKEKDIYIIYNDYSLIKKSIISTDLYYGLSISKIAKMSKLIHLVAGKDEDLFQECYLLTFLGIDNHLRSYLYWYGEWQQVSPLIMGVKSLILLAQHIDLKYFNQIGNKENKALPCVAGETWLSYWPPSDNFQDLIKEKYPIINEILNN